MIRRTLGLWFLIAVAAQGKAEARQGGAAQARTQVDRAIALMGGSALRAVTRVRLDMMTQWQRTSYRAVPWTDRPSFEPHVDVRDYTIPAWRNTRDFGARSITNVIRDSVAVTDPATASGRSAWPTWTSGTSC